MTTHTALVAQFTAAVDALIAKYPLQAAQVGRLTRHVRTKGGLTDAPAGTVVLYGPSDMTLPGDDQPALLMWVPKLDPLCTVIAPTTVAPVRRAAR